MIKTILSALTESLILESYKDVKVRFINDGADKDKVTKLLDLHKKLKDMNRLKKDEVNIDLLAKDKTFDEFKALMSRYSEKDTETKTDKWNELKNTIVDENDEWAVYSINTPEEAYLFHGLTKWCISSGSKEDAKKHFDYYAINETSMFFAIVRKNPIGDEYDYIMDQYNWRDDFHIYWDAEDNDHESLGKNLNVPSYENEIDKIIAKSKANEKNKVLKKLKLNDDGTYSYDGSLNDDVLRYFVKNGKFAIKFKEVSGDFICGRCGLMSLEGCPEKVGERFNCYHNELTSLKGCPKEVGLSFDCSENNLTSLEGAPKKVGEGFDCSRNNLTSLEGCPEKVGKSFNCSHNKLKSLKGSPEKIKGSFYCVDCNLTTLEGSPKEVGGSFWCNDNKLTSLKGAPEEVGLFFDCSENNLTSLEGAPKKVVRDFDCSHNKLTSLKGAPEEVGRDFNCKNNKDLKSLDGIGEVKGKIYSDFKK